MYKTVYIPCFIILYLNKTYLFNFLSKVLGTISSFEVSNFIRYSDWPIFDTFESDIDDKIKKAPATFFVTEASFSF